MVACVDDIPGHIACPSASKSEMVVPIRVNNQVVGVLDIGSVHIKDFCEVDRLALEDLNHVLAATF